MPDNDPSSDTLLERPRLEQLLDGSIGRRLTVLIGGAGTGKTTLLTQWRGRRPVAWHTVTHGDKSLSALARGILDKLRLQVPDLSTDLLLAIEGARGPDSPGSASSRADSLGAELCRDLEARLGKDLVLVLDDVHVLGDSGQAIRLVESLCRNAPPRLHVIAATRDALPFPISRIRVQGQAEEITAGVLAFTLDEVELLLKHAGIGGRPEHAVRVFERTGGWPVAVRLAIRAYDLATDQAASTGPADDATLFEFLAEEVISSESPGTLAALRKAAILPWITAEMATCLGIEPDRLFEPASRSVYVTPHPNRLDSVAISPLVRDYLLARHPLADDERTEILTSAFRWYEHEAAIPEALDCLIELGAGEDMARLITEKGETMLSAGMARRMVEAIERMPSPQRNPEVVLCEAEARQVLGDWEGAFLCYATMVPESGDMPARLAWRLGFLSHMRGDVMGALETYRRGRLDEGDLSNEAALLGWTASAHWLRGERDEAQRLANEALALARRANDSRALATAHTVLAMVAALDGDRAANDIHYLRALEHAERARDVIQTIRIRSNRGSHFLEEGDYDNALAELDIALRLADMTGFQLWRAMSLSNRAQVLQSLGRLEESISDLDQAQEIFRAMGSTLESYALAMTGDVCAVRGDTALARTAYEEAIRLAEQPSDLQALVPALSGLSRVVAAEDPSMAAELADRAASVTSVIGHVRALLAQGFAALAAGHTDAALAKALETAEVARTRHDLPGLAEALELEAAAVDDDDRARSVLDQARRIWEEIASPVGVARVDIAVADRSERGEGRELADSAAHRLLKLGAKGLALQAGRLARGLTALDSHEVSIRSLGGFVVFVNGEAVPASAWQSRVAREVVGMVVANRGRPLHREIVMERIWPDEDHAKAGNRLSVALSTARGVLDPERAHDTNHFLVADRDSIAISREHVEVDIESFFEEARRGRALLRSGAREQGLAVLRSAEARYVGEFLEDQPYADWAIGVREEARSEFIAIAASLAAAEEDAGDHDSAVRWYMRILEQDAYNEPAHLSLLSSMIAAGRHGTARRLYGVYVARMSELEVEPEPFPG